MSQIHERDQLFKDLSQEPQFKPGRLRRVSEGAADYSTGTTSRSRSAFELVALELAASGSGAPSAAFAAQKEGTRRFLVALSGRAWDCAEDWSEGALRQQWPRPLRGDRLYLSDEAVELQIEADPSLQDAGLGVLFEILAR
ncbi:MAG: hypothetical protein RRB13_02685 [bacterium]|nr:hypothetical protein [bacterium]